MRKFGALKPPPQIKSKPAPPPAYTVILRQGEETVTYPISSKTELLKCISELTKPFMTNEITIVGGAKHG